MIEQVNELIYTHTSIFKGLNKFSKMRQRSTSLVNILCIKHMIGRPGTDKDAFGGRHEHNLQKTSQIVRRKAGELSQVQSKQVASRGHGTFR